MREADFGTLAYRQEIQWEVKANPLVEVSQNYLRESRTIWNEIWYIVQANCTDTVSGNPQDDMMERLLSN